MDQDQHRIEVFNGLIGTTIDSVHGYEQAAELARNPRFKSLFTERAAARRGLAKDLEAPIRAAGGTPLEGGSIMGPMHRAFLALRGRFSGHSDRPVIEEVERGEAYIRDQFERAAQDAALPDEARQLIERALTHIRSDHDTIDGLMAEFH